MRLSYLLLLALFLASCAPTAPREAAPASDGLPARFLEPMPLYGAALGPFHRAVTTRSDSAQAYIDQGFQMMFAYYTWEAPRAFREAQRRDSTCAMCFWGEAWAWGPNLNIPMRHSYAPFAYAAAQSALERRAQAGPLEQALIDAMAVRYLPEQDDAVRDSLDLLFADAMAQVYADYPDDLDVGAIYADALVMTVNFWEDEDPYQPMLVKAAEVLEGVLARDIHHPGACHLYIHVTEASDTPERAEACAEHLGTSIPGASHINHMPSHTFNRVGRWGDAVRANIAAWHSDLRAEEGDGFAIYPTHNLHMLLFAASMDGQGGLAYQAARDYTKIVKGGQFYQALVLFRFGRFDELLALTNPPERPVFRGLWDFAKGYAHLRSGQAAEAQARLARVATAAQLPDSLGFRGHAPRELLGSVHGILAGEIHRAEGRLDEAIAAFEQAVALEDSLRYDEPEPLNFSARSWLGAALLEANRAQEAEGVYRAALDDHPHNGWDLLGLEHALRAQGRATDADAVHRDYEAAWVRADTWIKQSRF